jgi:hypothetical protein
MNELVEFCNRSLSMPGPNLCFLMTGLGPARTLEVLWGVTDDNGDLSMQVRNPAHFMLVENQTRREIEWSHQLCVDGITK